MKLSIRMGWKRSASCWVGLFAALLMSSAQAWDVGPAECKHKECSGGVKQNSWVETDAGKYGSVGAPAESCAAGEEPYGGYCYRACPTDRYRSAACTCQKKGQDALNIFTAWTDCGRFGGTGKAATKSCGTNDSYGGLCYKPCPQGSKRTAAWTCQHPEPWLGNTHLFIVNRARELLASSKDADAIRVASLLEDGVCRAQWESGLWDADGDYGEFPAWRLGSHFYNGAMRDWNDNVTKCPTYSIAGVCQLSNDNARMSAQSRLVEARQLWKDDRGAACYRLGLVMHYLTDVTQPMHASGMSTLDAKTHLHATLEAYVPVIQAQYRPTNPWLGWWKDEPADRVFLNVSVQSQKYAKPLYETVAPWKDANCTYVPDTSYPYTGSCYRGNPAVAAMLGTILQDAYQSTASYLYASMKDLK